MGIDVDFLFRSKVGELKVARLEQSSEDSTPLCHKCVLATAESDPFSLCYFKWRFRKVDPNLLLVNIPTLCWCPMPFFISWNSQISILDPHSIGWLWFYSYYIYIWRTSTTHIHIFSIFIFCCGPSYPTFPMTGICLGSKINLPLIYYSK